MGTFSICLARFASCPRHPDDVPGHRGDVLGIAGKRHQDLLRNRRIPKVLRSQNLDDRFVNVIPGGGFPAPGDRACHSHLDQKVIGVSPPPICVVGASSTRRWSPSGCAQQSGHHKGRGQSISSSARRSPACRRRNRRRSLSAQPQNVGKSTIGSRRVRMRSRSGAMKSRLFQIAGEEAGREREARTRRDARSQRQARTRGSSGQSSIPASVPSQSRPRPRDINRSFVSLARKSLASLAAGCRSVVGGDFEEALNMSPPTADRVGCLPGGPAVGGGP